VGSVTGAGAGSGVNDDDLFFHHARATPMGWVPLAMRAVVAFNPDPSRTPRRSTDDLTFVNDATGDRERDGDQEHQNRCLHAADPTPTRGVAFKATSVVRPLRTPYPVPGKGPGPPHPATNVSYSLNPFAPFWSFLASG
jgi:hypothetical protein